MSSPVLYIGNKNYSSWSLRPWILMAHFELDFAEKVLWLDTPEFAAKVAKVSPSRRVPVLHHQGRVIWDSLAICEYINETWLGGRGWPQDPALRALARSASDYYASLMSNGSNRPCADRMFDFDGLNGVLGTAEMLAAGKRYEGD